MTPEQHQDYLEFLCWVNRCLLPKDLELDLKKLGLNKNSVVGSDFKRAATKNNLNITQLYQDYIEASNKVVDVGDYDVGVYLKLYIEQEYKKWLSYKTK